MTWKRHAQEAKTAAPVKIVNTVSIALRTEEVVVYANSIFQMMPFGQLVFFTLFATNCSHPDRIEYPSNHTNQASSKTGVIVHQNKADCKVVGIRDGDTFLLLINQKEAAIRLAHIDCPEKKQPYGHTAKQFVSKLCFGRYVTLIHNNTYDRNKRLIAEVLLPDGRNLNKELIKNGLAWHFKKYSGDTCYARLEATARKAQAGLWKEPAPVAPWKWRHKNSRATVGVTGSQTKNKPLIRNLNH